MDIYIILVLYYETVSGKKMENGVNYLSKFDARMKGHVVDVPQ